MVVADGSGPEFNVSELTIYVNDALMFAPSMLLSRPSPGRRSTVYNFDVRMSDGGISATSGVFVDEQGRMVDFSTTNRWQLSRPG